MSYRRIVVFAGILLMFAVRLAAANLESVSVWATSMETPSLTGEMTIEFNFRSIDSVGIDSIYFPMLPEGWQIEGSANPTSFGLTPNVVSIQNFTFSYPIDNIPFYPVELELRGSRENEPNSFISETVYIYFTPYETIEVWSYDDFHHLKRDWYVPTLPIPNRIFVSKDSIPLSNIPDEFEPTEDWEESFQMEFIEGLAYGVPMLARHPDTLALDTTDVIILDSLSRADGCGPGRRRFLGTIDGNVLSLFNYANPVRDTLLPLEGIIVQIWEQDDFMFSDNIGDTVTDSQGYFTKTINTCQSLEGNEIEIRIRILAKSQAYNIVGKNVRNLGSVVDENTTILSWSYNNGNVMSPLNIGTLIINSGAHRMVHLAHAAYKFTNTNSGYTLESGLTVRADLSDTALKNNQFIPNWSCGLPVPSSILDVFADITAIPYAIILNLAQSNRPSILLQRKVSRRENTAYHEFGHFVMWQLQGKCFAPALRFRDDGHCPNCMTNPTLAWNEGWPTAFAMMVDNATVAWDNEASHYGAMSIEHHEIDHDVLDSAQGFGSEYLIACAVFDLWDGPDKFPQGSPLAVPTYYNDSNLSSEPRWWQNGEEDQVSLSFADICLHLAEGDYNATNNVIESAEGYYNNIIRYRGCEDRAKIAEVFDQNRVVGHIEDFPAGDFQGFSGDEISDTEPYPYNGTLWSMLFQHEHDVNQIPYYPYQDYNLATKTAYGSTFLNDDLRVVDGATLHFNKNIPIGWVYHNSPDRPALNSTMHTDLCAGMTLEASAGGNIVIGDQAVTAYADVRLKPGGTIILGGDSHTNTGKLLVNNHSRLYIEEGATLVIEEGAQIELAGNDAVLEIDGELVIRDNATFTFTGAGYVRWGNDSPGNNIVAGINSTIDISGTNKTDQVLIVKANAHIQPQASLGQMRLEDGLIYMEPGASISTSDADFVIDNVEVARYGSTGFHKGIFVNGQANHLIANSEFSGGTRGITAYQMWNQGATLRLDLCEFHDNEVGLQVHTRGVRMKDCSFHDNVIGYNQDMGSVLSIVQYCDFIGNGDGISFKSDGGDLYFRESSADENEYGIRFWGGGTLYGKCSSTSYNTEAGIVVAFGARLRLNDVMERAGSQHISIGNKYSVASLFSSSIDLYHGYNDFVPASQNVNHDVYGYMAISGTTAASLKAHYNHWNTYLSTTGTGPRYTIDYLLANSNSGQLYPVYLDDLYPIPAPQCAYGDTPGDGGTLRNCGGCSDIVTTHFDNVRLDSAMRYAISFLEIVDSTKDDTIALQLMGEIYSAMPDSPENDEEIYLRSLLYDLAKTAYNGAAASGKISTLESMNGTNNDPNLAVIAAIFEDAPGEGEVAEFLEALDLTLYEHNKGFIDSAAIQLDSLSQSVLSEFYDYLSYVGCYVDAEIQYMDAVLSKDEFEVATEACGGSKQEVEYLLANGSLERWASTIADEMSMVAYPLPMGSEISVQVRSPYGFQAQLALWDTWGRKLPVQVSSETPRGVVQTFHITTADLPSGVYILQGTANGHSKMQKLVKL